MAEGESPTGDIDILRAGESCQACGCGKEKTAQMTERPQEVAVSFRCGLDLAAPATPTGPQQPCSLTPTWAQLQQAEESQQRGHGVKTGEPRARREKRSPDFPENHCGLSRLPENQKSKGSQ
ncbi:hypothetical protein STEG23_006485 [Scotinomys teguina]